MATGATASPLGHKVFRGRASAAAASFNFNDPARARRSEVPGRQPLKRPSAHRYPIPPEEFQRLKANASSYAVNIAAAANPSADPSVALGSAATATAAPQAAPAQPSLLSSFEGIAQTPWLPYDAAMAAGAGHIVCAVNASVAVFDKTGVRKLQTTLEDWFSNKPELNGSTIFDPRLTYDAAAQKFILAATAFNDSNRAWFVISVSQTPDPAGKWWNYALDAGANGDTNPGTPLWADYPGLGLDAAAVYLTANMFQFGGPFQYVKLRILDKTPLYTGGTPTFIDLVDPTDQTTFTLQPCIVLTAAPAQYLVSTIFPSDANPAPTEINFWTLTDPLTSPVLSKTVLTGSPYSVPPHADQPNSAAPLDTGDPRVQNAVYRDGRVIAVFNTNHSWGTGPNVTAIYWIEIDPAGAGSITQQGIFGARQRHYFYPAVTLDDSTNTVMVFSRSGASEFPSLCTASRKLGAAKFGGSASVQRGAATYERNDSSGRNRWGDYSAISLEPGDQSRAWVYGGFSKQQDVWCTWVGQVRA
jgi:hypothetical protein